LIIILPEVARFMIGLVWKIVKIGVVSGFLFGALLCGGFLQSMRRMADPPSPLARNVTLLILLAGCTLLIGPGFSGIYRLLFCRLFPQTAPWVYGGINTLVLGILVNVYAAKLRLRDLRLIVRMNVGAAVILGWLIPILFRFW
jgi:hypothetical protein